MEPHIERKAHYYGDSVRQCLLLAAVIMLITLPIFNDLISLPLTLSIGVIVAIGLAAGMTNPVQFNTNVLDLVVSVVGFCAFEYEAVRMFNLAVSAKEWWLFAADQAIAVIFFIALYLSSKTVRAKMIR